MTTAKRLAKTLGGKWQYVGYATWECDDGKRTVRRCSAGVDQFDNPLPNSQWWLYGDGMPRRAEEYVMRIVATPAKLSRLWIPGK